MRAVGAYYNEIDPYAAQWLRNLIKAGHIADGEVDTRSIVDVSPDELRGYTQCHFFAGIGGWSHALRLAGWPDDRPVWTGSCPCQPFSVAGKGAGTDDPRHLWPHFHRLISAIRPPVVMGEQVAGKAGYGWFDGVRTDLEATGYAGRAVDIPALAVNAPHIRQRLYWVATDLENTSHNRAGGDAGAAANSGRTALDAGAESLRQAHWQGGSGGSDARSFGHMADARCEQRSKRRKSRSLTKNRTDRSKEDVHDQRCSDGDMAHPDMPHGEGGRLSGGVYEEHAHHDGGSLHGAWSDSLWLAGADGKARRVKSGVRLLANGVPARVGKLRAYGNAIVPPLAAEVIKAFMETEGENT